MFTRAIFPFFQFLILFLAIVMTGACAHPYMKDRTNDLADIVTASVGVGVGHQVRVGPVIIGLLLTTGDCRDWRYGRIYRHSRSLFVFVDERNERYGMERGKDYNAAGGWGPNALFTWACDLPFLMSIDKISEELKYKTFYDNKKLRPPRNPYKMRHPVFHSYYSQIEACAGFLGTVRLGINPGEFLDFLLGWVGVDFFDDDVEMEKIKDSRPEADKDSPDDSPPIDTYTMRPIIIEGAESNTQ